MRTRGLDGYQLEALVGKGGMAEVYRAVAADGPRAGQAVAVKRLLPALARDPDYVARFVSTGGMSGGTLGHLPMEGEGAEKSPPREPCGPVVWTCISTGGAPGTPESVGFSLEAWELAHGRGRALRLGQSRPKRLGAQSRTRQGAGRTGEKEH